MKRVTASALVPPLQIFSRSHVDNKGATGRRPLRPESLPPWNFGDQLRLGVTTLVGAVGLLVSWVLISGEPIWTSQIRWLAAGVTAIIVAGVGCGLWLLQGLRQVRERKRVILTHMVALTTMVPLDLDDGTLDAAGRRRCTAPRMTRYHRGACLLVQGKPVVWSSALEHEQDGREPCGVCKP